MSLKEPLPAVLEVLRLKKEDVAQDAGIHPTTLSRILHSDSRSPETVRRLELAVIERLVRNSRAEQGLGPTVTDPATLGKVATLIGGASP